MISTTMVECKKIEDFPVQGANSHSYLASDVNLDRSIAVKDIKNSSITNESVEEYFSEARIAAFAKHPLVMPVYYAGFDAGTGIARVVTPYYKNGCMHAYINRLLSCNQLMSIKEVISKGIEIAQGINHLHSLEILHLDIKPSNIIISNDDKIIVTDFGQSKLLNGEEFVTGIRLYCKNLSPETLQGVADKRTDIYQFGLLLYRLCNENLFQAQFSVYKTQQQLDSDIKNSNFPNRKEFNVHVPNSLLKIIKKCLNSDPSDRYADFYEVINDLCYSDGYDLQLNVDESKMHGIKNEKSYIIDYHLDTSNNRYDTIIKINGRQKSAFCKTKLTENQLRNNIKKAIVSIN